VFVKVERLAPGAGGVWREAVDRLVPAEDRSGELLSEAEAESSLEDDRCYLLVASVDGEVVGLLSGFRFPDVECGGTLVYLYDIEVSERSRCQGIGKALVRHLLSICEADDVDLVWAGTETSNRAARQTFESTGARLEGESYAEYEWDLE